MTLGFGDYVKAAFNARPIGMFVAPNWIGLAAFALLGFSPFTRLVHVWSGFGAAAYLVRPYQVVRARRLNVPAGHNQPRRPGAGV